MDKHQKSNCEELLRLIPKFDLLPLAESITKLELPSSKDAVPYILNYTKTPRELLERHLLTKDYLRDYLLKKQKAVPKDAKKNELIETILNMWKPDTRFDYAPSPSKGFAWSVPIAAGSQTFVPKHKDVFSPLPNTEKKQKWHVNEPPSRHGIKMDEHQKSNCEELLRLIPQYDLKPMAESITKFEIPSAKDAVSYILRYTKTPRELLESYPMTKDYLKGYLLNKGRAVPKDAKKVELIEIILKMWIPIKSSDADPKPFKSFGCSAPGAIGSNTVVPKHKDVLPPLPKDPSPTKSFACSDPAATGSNTVVPKRKDVFPPLPNDTKKQKLHVNEPSSRQALELNEDQKANCKELLNVVPKYELYAMAESTTKVKCTSSKEAIKYILSSTKTPEELLKKQAMKKTFLTLYLLQKKRQYSSNAKKEELIEIILKMWSSKPRTPTAKAGGSTGEDQKQKDAGGCCIN